MQNMLYTGGTANIFHFIFNIGAAIVCLLSIDYIKKYGTYYGEYYILIQASVLGMMCMAGAKDLLMVFMGLEVMSVCFYALAGINRKRIKANEAPLKYFLTWRICYRLHSLWYCTYLWCCSDYSIDVITSRFATAFRQ